MKKYKKLGKLFKTKKKISSGDNNTLISLVLNKLMNSLMKIIIEVLEVIVCILSKNCNQFYKIYLKKINHMGLIHFKEA